MLHGLLRREALVVVVAQQTVQEVQRLGGHQVLVLAVHKAFPSLAGVSARRSVAYEIFITFVENQIYGAFFYNH